MKRAGDVLSAILDERLMKKARGYSRLFAFWAEALQKNGIASAADHSRIRDLDRGILLVEADHPGWKQILQTKQNNLLNDFRRTFQDMDISGISLMLSQSESETADATEAKPPEEAANKDVEVQMAADEETAAEEPGQTRTEAPSVGSENRGSPPHHGKADIVGYDAIKDEGLKESLKRLEQSIATGRLRK